MKELEGALGSVLGYDAAKDTDEEEGMSEKLDTTKIDQ